MAVLLALCLQDSVRELLERARQAHRDHKPEEVEKHAEQAIRCDPRCAEAYYWRAQARWSSRLLDMALRDVTKAIELDPQSEIAHALRGELRFVVPDWKGALEDYAQVLKLNPSSIDARLKRSTMLAALGKADQALEEADAAIKLQRDHPEAQLLRVRALTGLGRWPEAAAAAGKALALGAELDTEIGLLDDVAALQARIAKDGPGLFRRRLEMRLARLSEVAETRERRAADIKRAIAGLHDPDPDARAKAVKELVDIGEPALAALEASTDAESRSVTRSIRERACLDAWNAPVRAAAAKVAGGTGVKEAFKPMELVAWMEIAQRTIGDTIDLGRGRSFVFTKEIASGLKAAGDLVFVDPLGQPTDRSYTVLVARGEGYVVVRFR